jgi:hypothetical protein
MRDGYAGTSIRAVARRAGRRRGDRPPRVCEQCRAARRHDPAGDPRKRQRAAGADPRGAGRRAPPRLPASTAGGHAARGAVIAIGDGAVLIDAELRPLRDRARGGVRAAIRAIAIRTTYLRVVEDCGLPPEHYAQWLTATTKAVLFGVMRRRARPPPRAAGGSRAPAPARTRAATACQLPAAYAIAARSEPALPPRYAHVMYPDVIRLHAPGRTA